MKYTLTSLFALLAIFVQAQNFTPGNVVVSRVGDGSATLGSGTAPVSLLEFLPSTASQSSATKTVNFTTSGTGQISVGGTTSVEGQLNLSQDGRYLSLMGYDAPSGTASTNNSISTSFTVTTAGTGYIAVPVSINGPTNNTGATATAYATVSGGAVTAITVVNGGSGYTSAPTFARIGNAFAASTTYAVGQQVVNGNYIYTVTNVTGASGLAATAPTHTSGAVASGGVTFTYAGTAATATTTITNGVVTSITVTSGGSGYTTPSTVGFSGGGGSGASAFLSSTSAIGAITTSSFTVINAGSGYTSAPTLSVSGNGSNFAGSVGIVPYWQGISTKKVIGRVDYTGAIDYSTSFLPSSTASAKSVASIDGTSFYTSINNIGYVSLGQTSTPTPIVSAAPRYVSLSRNQLYYHTGFSNIFSTNTALPTATSTTSTAMTLSTSLSSFGAVYFDLDPTISWNGTGYDVLYLSNSTTGLEKYYYNGTT